MADNETQQQTDRMKFTEDEQYGVLVKQSAIMQAKARLCDAQHALQKAQAEVETAQKQLAVAEARMEGATVFAGYSRGIRTGTVNLAKDASGIEV